MLRLIAVLALLIPAEPAFAEASWLQRLFPPVSIPSGKAKRRVVRLPAVAPLPLPRPDRADRGGDIAAATDATVMPLDQPASNPPDLAQSQDTPVPDALTSVASAGAGAEIGPATGAPVEAELGVAAGAKPANDDAVPMPMARPGRTEPVGDADRVAIAINPPSDFAPSAPASAPADTPAPADAPDSHDAADDPAPPPGPSACRLRLSPNVAIAPSAPDINGPGACGAHDMVRLEAVVLPDKSRVAVRPPAIIRCSMAESVARWVRDDVVPAAAGNGDTVKTLENYASYDCRGRNNIAGAKLSEHGKGNALDVRAFRLSNGKLLDPTSRDVDKALRESLRKSACASFTTVLGPGSDGYHENHIHIDLAERRNGYRLCQWDIHVPGAAPVADAAATGAVPPAVPLPVARPKRDGETPAPPQDKSRL